MPLVNGPWLGAAPATAASPLGLTLIIASSAAAIGVGLGAVLAWAVHSCRPRWRLLLESALLLPLALPPTVLGYYMLVAIGGQSAIGQAWLYLTGRPLLFTPTAAVLAATASAAPLAARLLTAAFDQVPSALLEHSRLEGATGLRLLWHVYLPLVRPSLLAAAALCFSRAAGDFGATIMVAGSIPGRTQTAALALYDELLLGNTTRAGWLAASLTLLCFATLAAAQMALGRKSDL